VQHHRLVCLVSLQKCDALIAYYATGFPLDKAQQCATTDTCPCRMQRVTHNQHHVYYARGRLLGTVQ
jgi:hypothetical protein